MIQTYRRFQRYKNRFVYQDTRSWRSYYDSHKGGVCVGDRTDEFDSFLGDWELFTGKYDKNGIPIYVGDIVKQVVESFDQFKHYTDTYVYDIIWDNLDMSIKCQECDGDDYSLSDIIWDDCEVIGNIHQEERFK
jgi:hypothetical protein